MDISSAKRIKLFIMDVDGVLTDGSITYTSSGEEIKSFNVKDGLGINLLKTVGIKTAIITGRKSPIVEKRAKELKIDDVIQGKIKKLDSYERLKEKYNLTDEEVLFIGDDIMDLPILRKVGIPVCVADAVEEVKEVCTYITQKNGGQGAVREVVDKLLKLRGEYEKAIERFINDWR